MGPLVNILLVDDHPENLLALEAMLAPLGQNLVKAPSGEEALKCLLRLDFAVILLDVQMPGMDGFETAELIRGRERSKHTPIIFLTALNINDTHISRGYQLGAVDYLLKPIVPDILLSKVAVFVELWQKTAKIEGQAAELEATVRALELQIDERIRTETALRKARDQLEQRVRERTAGLAQANQSLRAEIAERERAEQALRLLAEASSVLAEPIEYEERLSKVARLAVPTIADWCVIDVFEESGRLRRVAIAAGDPMQEVHERELQRRYPLDAELPAGAPSVIQARQPELYAEIPDQLLVAAARDETHLAMLRSRGLKSCISLPLEARDRMLGALTIATAGSERRYSRVDLPLAEDLGRRIAVAIDNARLYRAAQESIRMRDIFLSVAAHELRTPLTSLLGYTQLVERRAARNSTVADRDRQALRVVADQALRLSKMVTSLLDISRLQLGQLSIEPVPLDLGQLAERLVRETRPLLSQHTIEYIGAGAPAQISGDELRLEQALQNLIQNAVKYSPNGGAITVRVEQDDGKASVSVTDAGIGIPPEALPRLFHRFYRAPNVDPQHISGLGVGLYVVKEIVALHGGTIDVRSEVGAGSTFMFTIPLIGQSQEIVDGERVE
ncbi:MAG TPA: ATP-binding protein [Roseiflexaceae bacterium]|nr:ATP-binding protein [Roseiflexaceae bacterium]